MMWRELHMNCLHYTPVEIYHQADERFCLSRSNTLTKISVERADFLLFQRAAKRQGLSLLSYGESYNTTELEAKSFERWKINRT